VSPSPTPDHAWIVGTLYWIIRDHVEAKQLGVVLMDVDTLFGKHEVRRPDIFYFTSARKRFIGQRAIEGPPDLAVEVISPGNERTDRRDKFKLYADGKVKHYWIVDPLRRTIESYLLRGGKYIGRVRGSGSDVISLPPFPKLKIPLAKLWRPK